MIRSLHTANRNLNVLQKKLENNNANMANIKTPGYKFQSLLESTLDPEDMINYQGGKKVNKKQELGKFTFGNQIDQSYRSFEQGSLEHTTMDTDFALVGDGFFSVRMPNGQVGYTRNGNFKLDEDNRLVTVEGYAVLGRGINGGLGDIRVDIDRLEVDNQGNINDENIRFAIVEFNDLQALESVGDTIFTSNQAGLLVESPSIRQGYLEMSNVSIADSMVSLIEISRQFESTQKIVQMADETMSKAVNEIGRV